MTSLPTNPSKGASPDRGAESRDALDCLASMLFDGGRRTRMIGICAEPGMRRRSLITQLVCVASKEGLRIYRHDLSARDSESASALIVRVARESSRRSEPSLVAFDELPPSDEACVRRQARALKRMWEAGVHTVFSLPPEGSQLLDALPECTCVTASDLVVRAVAEVESGDFSYWRRRYTKGVPSLVEALPLNPDGTRPNPLKCAPYLDALQDLVGKSLRLTLSDDELRMRLAMLLLGHGSSDDLESAAGFVPKEILEGLRTNAPFFEVGVSTGSFSCPLDADDALLEVCQSHLNASCALFPDVCDAVIGLLAARGRYGRVASLLELPGGQRRKNLLLVHASSFLDAGAVDAVRSAACELAPYPGLELAEGHIRLLDAAVGALGERAALTEAVGATISDNAPAELLDLSLFAEARKALGARRPREPLSLDRLDALGRRLLVHIEARGLMAEGRLSAATRLLIANPCDDGGRSVSEALLTIDAEITRLLLCDASSASAQSVERAIDVLSSPELAGLEGYTSCLEVIRAVILSDEGAYPEVEQLVSRAERAGDRLVQALSLVGGTVIDLRRRALARASVRAELAAAVASGAGLGYIARVATLLGEVARFLLGEAPRAGRDDVPQDDLGRASALVRAAMLVEEDVVLFDEGEDMEPPRDAVWLLLVLGEGMGALSARLDEMLPLAWRHALMIARPRWRDEALGAREAPGIDTGPDAAASRHGHGAPIEIRLLGGFSVTVRGQRVPDGELEHRNAKSMLEYLLLRRGATAKRYQIVEQVWPEADYGMGFNRAYQATSTLRAAIAKIDSDLDPFVLSRATKAVSLDMGIIRCDVDEFRACAREAADTGDDARAVAMARRAERLYVGDLYVPPVDATGYVMTTRDELRRLYGDAMVAGSDAALRLGKKRTATRLAMNALTSDDMREDAVVSMVRALRASGRNVEADRQYQRYARRLMQSANRPPSRLLRRAAGIGEERGRRLSDEGSVEVTFKERSCAS